MAVNAAKTKYIVFRTQGKPVNPLDCNLVFNDNEIGVQNNPDLILQIERIHNNGGLYDLSYWAFFLWISFIWWTYYTSVYKNIQIPILYKPDKEFRWYVHKKDDIFCYDSFSYNAFS